MKLKALIIESTRHYRSVLDKILSDIGVECDIFENAEEALKSTTKAEYAFILVSRYLDDTTGELFLHRYREKYVLGEALTIMLTSGEVSSVMMDANNAGFKLVFNKKELDSIQTFLTSVLNNRTLNLKGKILFIEDQKSVAAATIAIFKNYQADIDHVVSFVDAKEKFSNNFYDLVITDYHLENEETGDDIIQLVRGYADVDKALIPILVVSGEADQKKRTSFLRNGANDFIIKPYDDDELIVRSSNLIQNKRIFEQAKKQQKELTRLAMTDQLTGLYNRHSLFDIGPKYLSDAIRHKFSVSLLVIDLDHFKKINDTHGHGAGDNVLKAVGQVLNDNCRPEDFVARYGGEEFVMILTHCDIDFTLRKAENIRLAIEESKPNNLMMTASIGAAALNKKDDFESLFEKADRAVYEAKDSGRNRVVIHPDKFDSVV
ncbi:MAG: diguanylate cyclase [Gammaproteobacteria bacterium]|nr:diguanylate cyclase [Gammaproteobacteria bacterium]MCW8986615.1 diguanylate cyclase [Gammaproteobacteria bacterium]